MSWILDGNTLPRPVAYARKPLEISKENVTLDGSHRKDIVRQKWIHVLDFQYLTQAQVSTLVSIYGLS